MKSFLRILMTPSCWMQNYTYSKRWDDALRRLLLTEKFTEVSQYTAKLGKVTLWVSNHPYASFHPEGLQIRASRATILIAGDKLLEQGVAALMGEL